HHHPSPPSPSAIHAHTHQTHTPTFPSSASPSPSSSLHTTIQRIISNALAVYGCTRHLDVLTYRATSSNLFTAAVVEHNPQGRAYIHCCSAPEMSRLIAAEHLLVITEDLLARLVEMDDGTGSEGSGKEGRGIKESGWGWLPSTPQSTHAIVFTRQNSFSQQQQLLQSSGRNTPGLTMPHHPHSQTQLLHHQHQQYLQQQPHNYFHPNPRDMNDRRTSSFGSLPNLNALGSRFDSAPVSRRESMANSIAGGGRIEGTITSSSNVSTPMPVPQNSHQLGGPPPLPPTHGIGHGHAALPPVPRSAESPAMSSAAANAGSGPGAGVGGGGPVVVPRPQRGGEKVRWIMGSEG
ncbi:hypothetical protein DM02DRAFT_691533, partial [Periconia macrospinosa]